MHKDSIPVPRQQDRKRYDWTMIAMHWLIGVLFIVQFALGWWRLDIPKQPPGLRAGWFNLHNSIGLMLAMLIAVRLGWRRAHGLPTLPASLSDWQRLATMANHRLLYACMLIMPLSGYLGSSFTKYRIRFFGMALPHWGWKWAAAKSLMSAVHCITSWIFTLLIAIHVLATLWHLSRRDGIFYRMFPQRRREPWQIHHDGKNQLHSEQKSPSDVWR